MSDEDVELQSWGWTDLSSYSSSLLDSELVPVPQTRTMSRVSLRLDDGLLDRSLPHSSASFSVGGASWKSSRSLKSRRSQHLSVSCSESLLLPSPLPPLRQRSSHSLLNSSAHSAASDASLLSSLLDASTVQDVTLVDAMWGLDHDGDPKESTIVANSTLIGSDSHVAPKPTQTLNRVYCTDCELEPASKHAPGSSSKHAPGSSSKHGPGSSATLTGAGSCDGGASVIYHRDRSRRTKTGATASAWEAAVSVNRWAAACFMSLLALFHMQMQKRHRVTDVLQLWVRRALTHTCQVCLRFTSQRPGDEPAHCGTMKLQRPQDNRSLCTRLREAFRCVGRRWCQMTAPDSAPDSTPLVPRFGLRVFVVLLLLVLSLCWLGPLGLQWFLQTDCEVSAAEGAVEQPPLHTPPTPSTEEEPERPVGPERSLASLWERVETGGRWAEQRHDELLQLFADIQQQVSVAQSGREELGAWLSGVLDHQLTGVRRSLEEERQAEQQRATSRLDILEQQLQELQRPEAVTSSPPGVSPDRSSHDALLAEVASFEAALKEVRREVASLTTLQDDCRRFNAIQQTISARVQDEIRTLVYGNQLLAVGGADADALPESLLQWLSQRYVSSDDLQVALSSVELGILRSVDVRLEQRRGEEAVAGTDLQTTSAITKEDVHAMVTSALRRFSQDQTGLADYALESGGGTILSTRCSETYETKAALLSLFGLPLWYFSQSPRAVIQPDIQPGNCWAFRGSSGFLVIRLSMRIVPTAFSLDHIPKVLAPSGTLRSAPRDFSVYGLDDERQESGKLLGVYTYDRDGDAVQTYAVTEENHQSFQIIEVKVLSNWGHEDYTCMYRFRVHGTPVNDP